jgi:DNA-binding response OmpR family regulator
MTSDAFALIIEDDMDLGTIFAEAIKAAGYETETIADGGQASLRLMEVIPSLVILDLHLPRVSGRQLLQQIRADDRLVATNVIVTTADGRQAEDLLEEADFCLIKPISFTQLRDLATRLYPRT